MNLRVKTLSAAGPAYARLRRHKGLEPVKGTASLKPSDEGPVRVICDGATYTLFLNGAPAPATR